MLKVYRVVYINPNKPKLSVRGTESGGFLGNLIISSLGGAGGCAPPARPKFLNQRQGSAMARYEHFPIY
jgi:hypothetical protein